MEWNAPGGRRDTTLCQTDDCHAILDRLRGERHAPAAEISAERHAETYGPLSEGALAEKRAQLAVVEEMLELGTASPALERRRRERSADEEDGSRAGPTIFR